MMMVPKLLASIVILSVAVAADYHNDHIQVQNQTNHWAVLVSGSYTYDNYRHQADTCHAYHLLKKNGFQEDHIIHFAYDDIANHTKNPHKGKIFNKPSFHREGVNVYKGCKIDYRGDDVSTENIIRVLRGEDGPSTTGEGKPVLQSDENSRVFFYFADHGAPGLVRVINENLYADELHQTFMYMQKNGMYKEMVIYFEACESGSMFESTLEDDMNIYAVTAANSEEVSWGTYCGPFHNWVHHRSLHTCLGDLFSVNWLENIDKKMNETMDTTNNNLRREASSSSLSSETLQDQYEIIKKETFPKSHVMQFGQISIAEEPLTDYFSGSDAVDENKNKQDRWWSSMMSLALFSPLSSSTMTDQRKMLEDHYPQNVDMSNNRNDKLDSAVNSRDIRLHNLYSNIIMNPFSEDAYTEYHVELETRMQVDTIMGQLFPLSAITPAAAYEDGDGNSHTTIKIDFNCYRQLIKSYQDSMCHDFTDYSMKYLKFFAAECDESIKSKEELSSYTITTKDRISSVCSHQENE